MYIYFTVSWDVSAFRQHYILSSDEVTKVVAFRAVADFSLAVLNSDEVSGSFGVGVWAAAACFVCGKAFSKVQLSSYMYRKQ